MKDLFDGTYRYTTYKLEDLVAPKAAGELIAIVTDGESRASTYVADFAGPDGRPTWRKLQELELGSGVIRGCAPGVDVAASTFTCPSCSAQRDCQALNPVCLACGYQDPRRFEVPEGGSYEVVAGPFKLQER